MTFNHIYTVVKRSTSYWINPHRRSFSAGIVRHARVLGIETSCDDTGCAIVDENGTVLGEALHSQHLVHLRNGGIIPPVAQDLHREYIEPIVQQSLDSASLNFGDIDAIAVTVKPGLPLSLIIGLMYAKHLAKLHNKPLIPIHHMKAHALTARMERNIEFPFLVLLISGGHCLLAIAHDVDEFSLLGECLDDAPGEAFDKTARRMKLKNLPEYSKLSGGQAIELAASKATDPNLFQFPLPMAVYKDCNFSMAGLKNSVLKKIEEKENELNIVGDGIIPQINDLCAGFQFAIAKHLVHRTQRAMEFIDMKKYLPNKKQLVISGGVACNNFIFKALNYLGEQMEYEVYRPSPKLCTDNGVMIAWNGMEKLKKQIDLDVCIETLDIESNAPIGKDIKKLISEAELPTKLIKLKSIF